MKKEKEVKYCVVPFVECVLKTNLKGKQSGEDTLKAPN